MAYIKTTWKNKIVERPKTFRQQQNADGTVTLIPSEGNIIEPGTPVNAQNMNKIENAIERGETELEVTNHKIANLQGEIEAKKELLDFQDKQIYTNLDGLDLQMYAYPDNQGSYLYGVSKGSYNKGRGVKKYNKDTFELIAEVPYTQNFNTMSKGSLVQDNEFIYVDEGGSYISKYSKNDLTRISYAVGPNYDIKYGDGYVYGINSTSVAKFNTSDMSRVAYNRLREESSGSLGIELSPSGKLFWHYLSSGSRICELDTTTLKEVKVFSEIPDVSYIKGIACDDEYLVSVTEKGVYCFRQSTGALVKSQGVLGKKNLEYIGSNDGYVYVRDYDMTNVVYQVDIPSLTPVNVLYLPNTPYKIKSLGSEHYYSFNRNILRSK